MTKKYQRRHERKRPAFEERLAIVNKIVRKPFKSSRLSAANKRKVTKIFDYYTDVLSRYSIHKATRAEIKRGIKQDLNASMGRVPGVKSEVDFGVVFLPSDRPVPRYDESKRRYVATGEGEGKNFVRVSIPLDPDLMAADPKDATEQAIQDHFSGEVPPGAVFQWHTPQGWAPVGSHELGTIGTAVANASAEYEDDDGFIEGIYCDYYDEDF